MRAGGWPQVWLKMAAASVVQWWLLGRGGSSGRLKGSNKRTVLKNNNSNVVAQTVILTGLLVNFVNSVHLHVVSNWY